jgi:S-formylglutathione hydrolase
MDPPNPLHTSTYLLVFGIKTNEDGQGTGDNFYKQGQLLPENFAAAAKEAGVDEKLNIRYQPDYDHSYYTMATFSDDHIDHAANYLFA